MATAAPILVYVLPVLLGDGIPPSSPGLARVDLEPVSSARSGDATILRFRVRQEYRQHGAALDR